MWLRASMQLKRIDTKRREPGAEFRWRVCRGLLLLVATLGTCENAVAQNYLTQIGAPTFTTAQSVELGFVNLSNGNLHLAIPIGRFPQRGARPFIAELIYDSRIWQVVSGTSNSWQPTNAGSQGGWRFATSADVGQMNLQGGGSRTGSWVGPATWTDPVGTAHTFPVSLTTSPCAVATSGAYANDASGYYMNLSITSCVNGAQLSWTAYAPDGTLVNSIVSGSHAPEDINGNYFTKDANGNVIDTLGRTPVTYVANGTGCSTNYCYNILNSQGTTSQIKITTTTVNVNTAFGQSGVTEYSGSFTAIQGITLPDGTSYAFGYDSGTTSGHYGGLTSITLPTGGQITYGYTNYLDSMSNTNRWLNSRVSGGGTWSYTPAVISSCQVGCQQKVTVIAPSTDKTVYTFTLNNGAWKSEVDFYTGSTTLVATLKNTWDFSQSCTPSPCSGAQNIRVLTTTTTLPVPGGTSITSQTNMTWADAYTSNVASVKAWKFYAGTSPTFPTTPDRETDFTYHASIGNNITNRVTQTTVKNSSGSVVAQTNFFYDDSGALSNSTPATGVSNHDDANYGLSNTARGNLTTIKRCTNLSSCSSNYVQMLMTYDTTGQALSVRDPKGNITNFAYADNFFNDAANSGSITNPPATYTAPTPTNAYLTSVTPPVSSVGITNFGYYFGTGKRAQVKDGNGADNYSHFVDSLDRFTHSFGPSLGGNRPWVLNVYAATDTQVDSYLGITDATPSATCTSCRNDRIVLDNLSRIIHGYLVNDADGQTTVDTVYDTSGRVQTTSHPYRTTNDSTYGLETPTYDGLNRVVKITHPDTTYSQTLYGAALSGNARTTQSCSSSTYGLGYPLLSVDEAGKRREIWIDGFGKTIEGDEPDSSGNLSSGTATCYSYDALGNLLGIAPGGTQNRTFVYDALSHTTSVTIPERANSSGSNCAVTYTFDSNGNVLTRTAPAPNQNSSCTATVTTCFGTWNGTSCDGAGYDALNRITKMTYSDGTTPTVQYGYDGTSLSGCTTTPPTLTDSNPKGRRTSMCDGSGATSWAHDAAGRVITEKRTILGTTLTLSYSYKLDGSIASVTYPSGRGVAYTVGNAQRLTAATDLPGTIQYAKTASYAPTGALNGMVVGQVSGGFSGITESLTYNSSLEYTSTQATSTAGTALNLSYCYTGFDFTNGCSTSAANNNGTVTGVTSNVDSNRTINVAYDPLNRISSAASKGTSGVDCWGQSFSPDTLANLNTINNTQCSSGTLSVTVDSHNHITNSGFAYDAAGNTTQDGSGTGYSYSFDAENRLTKATGMTGGPYCYVYDGQGLRVAKKSGAASDCSGGTIVKLYWRRPSGDALVETDSLGNALDEYVFFAGRRIAARDNSLSVYYYFADPLGSTRSITDANGKLCYDADFTPYGQEMSHTERLQTTACPPSYKFTGYERDPETGLDYAFARYYSSGLGRLLSPDPIGGLAGNLQSHNAYTYVVNNPTNLRDPVGFCPPSLFGPPCWGGGEGAGGGGGECTEDAIAVSCSMAYADLASGSAVQCPNNDCGFGTFTPYQCIGSVCGYMSLEYAATHRNEWDGVLYSDDEWASFLDDRADAQRQALADAISYASDSPDGANWDYIYNHLNPYKPGTEDLNIQGGNVDFTWTGDPSYLSFVPQSAWDTGGCTLCRYGSMEAIHYNDGLFHLDTASPAWGWGLGLIMHGFVDVFLGNINPSVPIGR